MICLKVNSSFRIRDVWNYLVNCYQNLSVLPEKQGLTHLIFHTYYEKEKMFGQILNYEEKLNNLREGSKFFASEVLTEKGKQMI